jgi:hypothetical protein
MVNIQDSLTRQLLIKYINEHPDLFHDDILCRRYDTMTNIINKKIENIINISSKIDDELKKTNEELNDLTNSNVKKIEQLKNQLSK